MNGPRAGRRDPPAAPSARTRTTTPPTRTTSPLTRTVVPDGRGDGTPARTPAAGEARHPARFRTPYVRYRMPYARYRMPYARFRRPAPSRAVLPPHPARGPG